MKSTYSEPKENCVDVDLTKGDNAIGVSDTKNPDGATLVFTHDEWDAFVAGVKAGEFDRA